MSERRSTQPAATGLESGSWKVAERMGGDLTGCLTDDPKQLRRTISPCKPFANFASTSACWRKLLPTREQLFPQTWPTMKRPLTAHSNYPSPSQLRIPRSSPGNQRLGEEQGARPGPAIQQPESGAFDKTVNGVVDQVLMISVLQRPTNNFSS